LITLRYVTLHFIGEFAIETANKDGGSFIGGPCLFGKGKRLFGTAATTFHDTFFDHRGIFGELVLFMETLGNIIKIGNRF
jgi:hypothetical protein